MEQRETDGKAQPVETIVTNEFEWTTNRLGVKAQVQSVLAQEYYMLTDPEHKVLDEEEALMRWGLDNGDEGISAFLDSVFSQNVDIQNFTDQIVNESDEEERKRKILTLANMIKEKLVVKKVWPQQH